MLSRMFFLTLVLTTLTAIVVGNNDLGRTDPPPLAERWENIRMPYAETLPDWVVKEIELYYDDCLQAAPSKARDEYPRNRSLRLTYIVLLFQQCVSKAKDQFAARMKEKNEGRSHDRSLIKKPGPNSSPSQLTLSPEAKPSSLLQRLFENANYYIFSGSRGTLPGGAPGRLRPIVGVR